MLTETVEKHHRPNRLRAVVLLVFCFSFAPCEAGPVLRQLGSWGFDLKGRDLTAKPGDNFYRYANGSYLDRLTIPPDRSGYSTATILTEASQAKLYYILKDAVDGRGPGSAALKKKIGDYFAAFMDSDRIERRGATPLQPEIDRVRSAASREQLVELMGGANRGFYGSIFDLSIEADSKDPSHYAVFLSQPPLGLPGRRYYLEQSFSPQVAQYRKYAAALLRLIRYPDAEKSADEVVHFETAIARLSLSQTEERDPDETYNPKTVAQLKRDEPEFPWRALLKAADLGTARRVIVDGSDVRNIAALFCRTPLPALRAWQAFTLASNAAPFLSSEFANAAFDMYGRKLGGQRRQTARWQGAVRLISGGNDATRVESMGNLGDALGQLYVASYFSPAAKQKAELLAADLKSALRARLKKIDWMSPATKAEALRKLDEVSIQIGYPRDWRDYSRLNLSKADLYGDIETVAAFNWQYETSRLFKSVHPEEWHIAPQTVNAYYYAPFNQIVLTAAVLQPPAFDPEADAAVNYGGIGAILGHELTHGFDDVGRKFDAAGRMRDWWTAEDSRHFEGLAANVAAQFSACEPLPGLHVNGRLTLGENIADLGGLLVALDAYHASLGSDTAPLLNGLTGDQRFFLGFAQVRRGKQRPEALHKQIVADPHTPDECRVNTDVRNIETWYRAFDVEPGDKLYLPPPSRARVW